MSQDSSVIVISGGSRGLGLAAVEHFLKAGHQVASFSRTDSPSVKGLSSTYSSLWFQTLDAADSRALVDFVSSVHARYGRIDGLVNNAAVAFDTVLPLQQDDAIQQMLDINLRATIVLCREASRLMLLRNSGTIVNISSIIAQQGFSGLAVYAATKAGMIGLTRSLARELGPRGIRVNAVAPGYLETEMSSGLNDVQRQQIIRRTPLGRLGTVDDVVPVIDFLLSPASAFVTGQVITVDGGSSV